MQEEKTYKYSRKPEWLKKRLPRDAKAIGITKLIAKYNLHTICTSGMCPNIGECWDNGTATFMILGDICTRSCKFCNVATGKPLPPDWNEPMNVAKAIRKLGLRHAVITSVDRDDLADKGAKFWAATIQAIKQLNPHTTIEALIPDFDADEALLQTVLKAGAEVVSHNLETVRRITPLVRTKAKYDRSLKTLSIIAKNGVRAKTGIMVGLGETQEEVLQTMDDALNAGVEVFTIGQYLQPSKKNIPVAEFVKPEIFEFYKKEGLKKGFKYVESAPLVRSSYHAEKHVGN